jgi:hypothetical protein
MLLIFAGYGMASRPIDIKWNCSTGNAVEVVVGGDNAAWNCCRSNGKKEEKRMKAAREDC